MKALKKIYEQFIGAVAKQIPIKINLDKSNHANDRQSRDPKYFFSDDDIKNVVNIAMPKIVNMLMLDELDVEDYLLLKVQDMNIIGVFKNENEQLTFVIVTVMKKADFHPKAGTKVLKIN